MARGKAREQEDGDEGGDGWFVTVGYALIILMFSLFILAYVMPKSTTESEMFGVRVVSEIPLERLQRMEYIALYNTTSTPAELTCKFELSAISKPDPRGYRIRIEEGETGITLREKDAVISGRTQGELLNACHAFACMRDGVECPNFMELDSFIRQAKSMSLIIDSKVDSVGGRGYAEIMYGLSYMQSRKADANGDGVINQSEIDANEFFIYPFLKEGDVCNPQPLNNLIQNWSRTNRTSDCSEISPAIMLVPSNRSAITVSGGQVVVSGDGDGIHTSSIILRDFISPELIRRMYGFK
jgi:hypothetical protein